MAFPDAKRELTDARAVVVTSDQREFSDAVVVRRKWENIPLEKSQQYIEYLDSLERSVVNPSGCLPGTYKILRNTYVNDDGEREIHQFLAKDLHTSAPIDSTSTQWELDSGQTWNSGSSRVILILRDVDPLNARDIADALPLSPDKFTNAIYTVTDGLLDGTWYNRSATFGFDENGVGWVRWFLSLHNNDDFWTTHYLDKDTAAIRFYKLNATDTSKEDFLDNYYFSPGLDWYYTEDGGANYTKLNGEAAAGAMPADAANLRTQVAGRSALVQADYSDERDDWFITANIQFGLGNTDWMYSDPGDALEYNQSKTTAVRKEWGFGVSKAVVDAAKAKYQAAAANGVVNRLEIDPAQGGTYNFSGITITKTGMSDSVTVGTRTVHIGRQAPAKPDPVALGIDETAAIGAEISYNVEDDTWSWTITENRTRAFEGEGPGGSAMIEYGEPLEIIRDWQYTGQLGLPNGGVPDVGTYSSDGKTLTRTQYDVSINPEDSTYSWRKREIVTTVPSGTYTIGGQAFYERDHRFLRNWAMDSNGDAWKTGAVNNVLANGLNLYFAQIARKRLVVVEETAEYFVQQPSDSQFDSIDMVPETGAAIKDQRSVVKLGKYLYAATRRLTTLYPWTAEYPGPGSELVNFDDVFMTKAVWYADDGNPEYNQSPYPMVGDQI